MPDPRIRNDRRRLLSCRLALEKLSRDDGALRALAAQNILRWERNETCGAPYARRWREILSLSPAEAQAVVLANTDAAAALRQNHPFAGFFSEPERRRLRERSDGEEIATDTSD
jgi:hypothetical protein